MIKGIIEGTSFACAISQKKVLVTYKYNESSILFSIAKAKKGILEKVVIKNVKLFDSPPSAVYIDTFNSLWNENMLCSRSEAESFAVAYWQGQKEKLLSALRKCSDSE